MADKILKYIASFIAVVIVLTTHEFAHAYVAHKCGDDTAKWNGRMTLNPLKHFDLMGLICFTLVGFGWAKPVPVNPYNFKKYRLGSALTAIAGVVTNYVTAFIAYPLFLLILEFVVPYLASGVDILVFYTPYYIFAYSLSFFVFNLLPLHPLDGFRLVEALNKRRGKVFRFLQQYGHYILLFLIAESFICGAFVDFGVYQMEWFDVLGYVMQFATSIFGWPITAFWGLFL